MSDSTRKTPTRPRKLTPPKKPYDGFPLSPHASGKWQKKIRGTIHYFGRWAHVVNGVLTRLPDDGAEAALNEYKEQAEDLHAGRTLRVKGGELTVGGLCNKFLSAKQQQYEAGELSARMFKPGPTPVTATGEYKITTDQLIAQFGGKRLVDDLAADDFAALRASLAKRLGPVRLGNEVQKVRTVFKYGYEAGLIDKPMRFGPQFEKPSRSVMRRHKAKGGEKLFTAEEVRRLVEKAGVPLKAMILLGVNAGFGGADCGSLPLSAIDLEGGWVTFPRPKTGIARRAALWPETVTALREAMKTRPEPKAPEHAGLAFITKYGKPWVVESKAEAVAQEMGKLLRALRINGRKGLGFYTLRHTFRTVADASKDFPAVRLIMGHADGSIDAVYRERIEDSRIKAVTDHVHAWLFPLEGKEGGAK